MGSLSRDEERRVEGKEEEKEKKEKEKKEKNVNRRNTVPETAESFDFSSNWKESSLCLTAGTSMRYLWDGEG